MKVLFFDLDGVLLDTELLEEMDRNRTCYYIVTASPISRVERYTKDAEEQAGKPK